ncbi:MAG: DUF2085 domain-containing protein [Candidatus Bilamarchaeaceae archaeon]
MDKKTIKKLFYVSYVILLIGFVGGAFLAPFVAFKDEKIANMIYEIYAPTCHQKISRSFCVFDDNPLNIGDCTPQLGKFIPNDNKIIKTEYEGKIGYKIAFCSRDTGIYGMMLIAALIYPLLRKWDSDEVLPPIYFILALIPLGIDGGLQLLGALNLVGHYESTNTIRFLTGAFAGFAATFYLIPLVMNFIEKR